MALATLLVLLATLAAAGVITHTLTVNWNRSSDQIAKNVSVTADGEHNFSVSVPDATVDKQVDVALDVSELQLIYISSDQDVTVETNSGAAPANTLTVKAGKPLVWYKDCGLANPLTVDVTALFITNASGATANVEFRFLEDATP